MMTNFPRFRHYALLPMLSDLSGNGINHWVNLFIKKSRSHKFSRENDFRTTIKVRLCLFAVSAWIFFSIDFIYTAILRWFWVWLGEKNVFISKSDVNKKNLFPVWEIYEVVIKFAWICTFLVSPFGTFISIILPKCSHNFVMFNIFLHFSSYYPLLLFTWM